MDINTSKVIQSVKFHISHQMKPYSIVKVICGSSYTCFSIFWELAQVWEIRPEFPLIIGTNTEKFIHGVKTPHLTSNETLIRCKGHLRVNLYLFCIFVELGQVGEFSPITPNHGQRYTESHPEC